MILLTRLLLLEPGTIQSHPDMGVGLVSKYRYSVEGEEFYLKSAFQDQIRKYLPQLQPVDIQVKYKQYTYYITATIDNTIYGFTYGIDSGNLSTNFSKIADL